MNYNKEMTEYLVEQYIAEPTRDTVERLSNELKKSQKSIIGKLSKEGVYRKQVYKTKTGENPVTKMELVVSIADALGFDVEDLAGLDKSPKATLKKLEEKICQ